MEQASFHSQRIYCGQPGTSSGLRQIEWPLLWPVWYFNHAKAWHFNHAEAFRWATRHLIYNDVGHVNPYNPTKYRNIIKVVPTVELTTSGAHLEQ